MRRKVVFFYKQDCLVCSTAHRDLTMSGVDLKIDSVCVDNHPMLRGKQSVPALFVLDTKDMHVGSSSIMKYIRSCLMEDQMMQMRNDAAQAQQRPTQQQQQQQQHYQNRGPPQQQQQQQQQQHYQNRGPPQQQQQQQQQRMPQQQMPGEPMPDEPTGADWQPSDGQAFSWLSGESGGRVSMGIEYEDASTWTAPPPDAESDIPGRGRSATGTGVPGAAPPDRMLPPQINTSMPPHQQMSLEHIKDMRLNEASWMNVA
jgi:hypothetical protein